MNNKLILGLALAVVLVSGCFFGAQACEFGFNGCMPLFYPASCGTNCASKDMDKNTMTRQESPATTQEPSKYDTDTNKVISNDFGRGKATNPGDY